MVEKAYNADEFEKLFLGEAPYTFNNLKHIPAVVATDIGAIIEHGLYVLYQNGNKNIPEKLKSTVLSLLNGTPVEIWTAYSIIWHENWCKKHNKAVFNIYDIKLRNELKKSINNNKSLLIACKKLVGQNSNEGLWEDINRLENNLLKKYGERLI